MAKVMNYYIVNEIDRPYKKHVAGEYNGKLYYLWRGLESSYKEYDGMGLDRATPIEDFGFEVEERDEPCNDVIFVQRKESIARYKCRNGEEKIRKWQGDWNFCLPKLEISDLKR